jgi:hypothetical protein
MIKIRNILENQNLILLVNNYLKNKEINKQKNLMFINSLNISSISNRVSFYQSKILKDLNIRNILLFSIIQYEKILSLPPLKYFITVIERGLGDVTGAVTQNVIGKDFKISLPAKFFDYQYNNLRKEGLLMVVYRLFQAT